MKQTINIHQFRQAFQDMGRIKQFSYDGLEVLFNYIEACERDEDEEEGCELWPSTVEELAEQVEFFRKNIN